MKKFLKIFIVCTVATVSFSSVVFAHSHHDVVYAPVVNESCC